jgi:radical SAM superfamily enzyme YgiQ (UPF0313 family)
VVRGNELGPLWDLLGPPMDSLPYHEPGEDCVGVMKLTDGCPFACTYCSVPLMYHGFDPRPPEVCLAEVRMLARSGVRHIVLYDDALLFKPEQVLLPFLEGLARERLPLSFHTPNALHARFVTRELADLLVRAGFHSFYLGFESASGDWLKKTGGKSSTGEFERAVECLKTAGAPFIGCYLIIGHPEAGEQDVEGSMLCAHRLGVRITLSEFAPVPGTVDGEKCSPWADLSEPLSHNKTAFTIRKLGAGRVNEFKSLCRTLNQNLPANAMDQPNRGQ